MLLVCNLKCSNDEEKSRQELLNELFSFYAHVVPCSSKQPYVASGKQSLLTKYSAVL